MHAPDRGEAGHRIQAMAQQTLSEIGSVFERLAADAAERMCEEILSARRIACYGVGREGLMMKDNQLGSGIARGADKLFEIGMSARVPRDLI